MYTIQEVANRVDKNSTVRPIIEVASKMNSLYSDLTWVPANGGDHHMVSLDAGLPAAAYSRYNQGVAKSTYGTVTIREKMAGLEVSTEIEQKLLKTVKNPEMFRFQNVLGCKRGMVNTVEDKLFYEQIANVQDGFDGLHTRYSDANSEAAVQIVDAEGSTNGRNSSIWFVKTGEKGVQLIYPDDGMAGIEHVPHPVRAEHYNDDNGVKRVKYMLDDDINARIGIAIEDWRSVSHIKDIDTTNIYLPSTDNSYVDLVPLMIRALHKLNRSLATGGTFCYMSESVFTALDIQQRNDVKNGGQLTYEMVNGKSVAKFRGVPIRISDAILTNMNPL